MELKGVIRPLPGKLFRGNINATIEGFLLKQRLKTALILKVIAEVCP
jgi:hypothetical protein